MIDPGTFTLAQAQEYCAAYAAAVPQRVMWLWGELRRTGCSADALDGPDGLIPLWE